MYTIEFSKAAEKQIDGLDSEIKSRIFSSLDRIKVRPYPHVKKLIGVPFFALRVGKYRVILDIRENILIIYVIEVGHRKNIYKKF
jgi:mRNA interferase RelE/StbE